MLVKSSVNIIGNIEMTRLINTAIEVTMMTMIFLDNMQQAMILSNSACE